MSITDPTLAFRLDGLVAVVTGASSGLGARFVSVLHDAGATVVAAARRADRLEALATGLGPKVIPVVSDVTDPDDRIRLVTTATEISGSLDIVVNNAGLGRPKPAEDEPIEEFAEVVDVNLTSVFAICQLAGRQMLEQGRGSIVNVASILGLVAGSPIKQGSYTASKGAVINLTRELGAQWADRGVRVNALAPGWFESEMTAEMWADDKTVAFVNRNTPAGRRGAPHELDGALLFLVSQASTFVNGHTLVVDGGWTAR